MTGVFNRFPGLCAIVHMSGLTEAAQRLYSVYLMQYRIKIRRDIRTCTPGIRNFCRPLSRKLPAADIIYQRLIQFKPPFIHDSSYFYVLGFLVQPQPQSAAPVYFQKIKAVFLEKQPQVLLMSVQTASGSFLSFPVIIIAAGIIAGLRINTRFQPQSVGIIRHGFDTARKTLRVKKKSSLFIPSSEESVIHI